MLRCCLLARSTHQSSNIELAFYINKWISNLDKSGRCCRWICNVRTMPAISVSEELIRNSLSNPLGAFAIRCRQHFSAATNPGRLKLFVVIQLYHLTLCSSHATMMDGAMHTLNRMGMKLFPLSTLFMFLQFNSSTERSRVGGAAWIINEASTLL